MGNSVSKLFAELERGDFIRDEPMPTAGYKRRLREFIDRVKMPNRVRIYALALGLPLQHGDRASLFARLVGYITSNPFWVIAFSSFSIMKKPYGDPVVAGFESLAPPVFQVAKRAGALSRGPR